jgi:hypothetical protein
MFSTETMALPLIGDLMSLHVVSQLGVIERWYDGRFGPPAPIELGLGQAA